MIRKMVWCCLIFSFLLLGLSYAETRLYSYTGTKLYFIQSPSEVSKQKFQNILYEEDLTTGKIRKIGNLSKAGIYKVISILVNKERGLLFLTEYTAYKYKIKVINLSTLQLIAVLDIETEEPDMRLLSNLRNGDLYVTYWDERASGWITKLYYAPDYLRSHKFDDLMSEQSYFSDDGKYLFSIFEKDQGSEFRVIDTITSKPVIQRACSNLGINRTYARVVGAIGNEVLIRSEDQGKYSYYLLDPFKDEDSN